MATVTGLTADRMLAIEAASVVDGDVVGNDLILTKHDGSQINAGNVRGPAGPQGPIGSDLAVMSAKPVLEVGMVGQIRAGRQLTVADFTNMGLSAPIGLWNLSDLTDASGNGRNLLNKGAVGLTTGILGAANTAARFTGSTGQALYIPDTGAADPFRIKTGTFGCWFRSAKRGTSQYLMSKAGLANQNSFELYSASSHNVAFTIYPTGVGGAATAIVSTSDVCDDRWHFIVCVIDGAMMSVYVDGALEITGPGSMPFGGSSPFNIGAGGADAANPAGAPSYGCVDEAFITNDVLSEDQIRNLYCVKIPHTLAVVPSRLSLNVQRRRRGGALSAADFAVQPIRLYNFSAGSLGDEGSASIPVVNNNGSVIVAGADGGGKNGYWFNSAQSLYSPDTGLPAGATSRSYGLWLKTAQAQSSGVLAWGTMGTADARLTMLSNGALAAYNGGDAINGIFVADGRWHHIVITEENTPIDGIKRKMYMDGKIVGVSLAFGAITLAGATFFRIGSNQDGFGGFIGHIDGVFVTNVVLTGSEVARLYAKGGQALVPSPKSVGDHVEGLTTTDLLALFDTLDSTSLVDLTVAA